MKRILVSFCILAVLFVFPHAARAQFLEVDCTGQNPSAFPNINSALPAVAGPGSFIFVTGPCNETVVLNNANGLSLGAFFGQTANMVGQLIIVNSQNVTIYGLNITNPSGEGIYVQNSRVTLDTVNSSGNGGHGLHVTQSSDVTINAQGIFNNNQGYGIYTDGNSFTHVVSWAGMTDISNNQNAGMWVVQANVATFGNTHIANNGYGANTALHVGIDVRGGGKVQLGSFSFAGPNVIENNASGGVSLQENAEISLFSLPPNAGNVVRNNGPFGVAAGFGSQVTLAGAQITGHTGPGVDIFAHSQLYGTSQIPSLGGTQVQDNGTTGDPLSAGVRVDGNSEALLRGVNLSQNNGPAILALVNSSVDFAGNTFSGNTGVITCDSTSTMVTDLAVSASNPASGLRCGVAHTLGNRVMNVSTPVVPDISAWKAMHSAYQQRSAAKK
jgi:parallel beta helix pectate lyase-like protein